MQAPSGERRAPPPAAGEQEVEQPRRCQSVDVDLGVERAMQAADEQPAGVPRGDSTLDDDLLEMEAFVSQIPAADGSVMAAAPKLPPKRNSKRKKTTTSKKTSQVAEGAKTTQAAGASIPAARVATPGIVKSTRGKRTSAEVWAKLSDKEKARRESNRRSAQLAKKKKADEIKKLEDSNAQKRAKIAELDKLLPALTEEARRAAAEVPEQVLDPNAYAAVAAAVGADPVLEELFGE